MKQIKNQITDIDIISEDGKSSSKAYYSDLITILIKQGQQGGFDYEDIKNRIAIDKAVKASDPIELEDSYFEYLHKLVKDAHWPFWHEDLIKFCESITNIKNSKL